ncbi:MAG: nicotinate-nucleotide adenylyltransferase [Pyrinomonadaceae bacterium]|jgi:nicotinate-nucleotide adenylyltransferase|nr:nicotinate-nucleotide adenylyltransferase [Pyrinomonadaceae bacterium]
MKKRQRIAIYGGTFDPVHNGHLEIARRVTPLFELDEFLFLPALVAPHKQASRVSSSLHRYAMLAIATMRDPRLAISTFELERPSGQYTVDTLLHFRSQLGESTDLFFVMGADSWVEITTWREWRRLLTLADFIVVTRPGYQVPTGDLGLETSFTVVDVQGQTEPLGSLPPATEAARVFVTDVVLTDVSATAVRQAAHEGRREELDQLVPYEVADYLRKYKLYRNSHET